MAQTVSIIIFPEDRARLAAIIADRNSPQKHVQRARIILRSGRHLPVLEVARQVGASRPAVWRWQMRYAEQGVDGLLRDKARKPGKKPLSAEIIAKVLALPCSNPPGEATHWTGRSRSSALVFHFTPTSASWLNAVEGFFSIITRRKIRRGVFKSAADLEEAIGRYIRDHNGQAKPFVWTKTAKTIFEKLSRLPAHKM